MQKKLEESMKLANQMAEEYLRKKIKWEESSSIGDRHFFDIAQWSLWW